MWKVPHSETLPGKKTMYSCAVRKRACALKNSCMRSFQMTINLDVENTFHLVNDYYFCIVMTAPFSCLSPHALSPLYYTWAWSCWRFLPIKGQFFFASVACFGSDSGFCREHRADFDCSRRHINKVALNDLGNNSEKFSSLNMYIINV